MCVDVTTPTRSGRTGVAWEAPVVNTAERAACDRRDLHEPHDWCRDPYCLGPVVRCVGVPTWVALEVSRVVGRPVTVDRWHVEPREDVVWFYFDGLRHKIGIHVWILQEKAPPEPSPFAAAVEMFAEALHDAHRAERRVALDEG